MQKTKKYGIIEVEATSMDFKRKAYEQLRKWKEKEGHKPLVVEGLRQVGKSYIVSKFAKENYENAITLDFRHRPELRLCFKKSLAVDEIIGNLEPYFPTEHFIPHKTCLIFEEIGDCAEARSSLKSFFLDGRYDVLATGSLLGVENYRRKKKLPVPTGYEEFLKMRSMDFEEFLWAMGCKEETIALLKEATSKKTELPPALDHYFRETIKRYAVIGGMPSAVEAFLSSSMNYLEARKVLESLLHDYRADFGRFINENDEEEIDYMLQAQLNQVFSSLPAQLGRADDNYKFKLSELSKKARYYQYEQAFTWLEEAGLVIFVKNVKAIEKPLQCNEEKHSFKAFISDPGLLMASFPISTTSDFLNEKLGSRKGAIYENLLAKFIADASFPLYYFGNQEKHLEIDFLIEGKDGIILLEEKSTNGKMAASRMVMEGKTPYKAEKCIKVNSSGVSEGSFFTGILQYMAPFFLEEEKKNIEAGLFASPLSSSL